MTMHESDRAQKKMMAFQWCTKFVADLDPGCCSLGAKSVLTIDYRDYVSSSIIYVLTVTDAQS